MTTTGELHGLSSVDETEGYLTVVDRQSCLSEKTTVKAKFHYTSWFGASSEPASVMGFRREPASSC